LADAAVDENGLTLFRLTGVSQRSIQGLRTQIHG
jgi:hypothetical protein